ncbi:hypothetical protein HAZT_HAZT011115 [Hyalella azteca]|uniref:Uncharacterized protein n=1 Tax=Hyalella azteca TaxID=294128 RepID=A0A6A0HGP0_HYAAZ|nr:hypothetical protein HAZT_HAZT011115 [Hyalella azteca]
MIERIIHLNCLENFCPGEPHMRPVAGADHHAQGEGGLAEQTTAVDGQSPCHAQVSATNAMQLQSPVLGIPTSSSFSAMDATKMSSGVALLMPQPQKLGSFSHHPSGSVGSVPAGASAARINNGVASTASQQQGRQYTIVSSSSSSSFSAQPNTAASLPAPSRLTAGQLPGAQAATSSGPQQPCNSKHICSSGTHRHKHHRHSTCRSSPSRFHSKSSANVAWKRKEAAAAICVLVKACSGLLAGVHELQFTAMTTLNKIIDAAIVYRIGDLTIVQDHHLLPADQDINAPYTRAPYSNASYTHVPYSNASYTHAPYSNAPYTHDPYSNASYTHASHNNGSYTHPPYSNASYTHDPYSNASYTHATYSNALYIHAPYSNGSPEPSKAALSSSGLVRSGPTTPVSSSSSSTVAGVPGPVAGKSRSRSGLSRSLSRCDRSRRRSRNDEASNGARRGGAGGSTPPFAERGARSSDTTGSGHANTSECDVIPGRGNIGHYGMWRQMWRMRTAWEETHPFMPKNTTSIIGEAFIYEHNLILGANGSDQSRAVLGALQVFMFSI